MFCHCGKHPCLEGVLRSPAQSHNFQHQWVMGCPQSHKLRYAFVQVWVARENRTPFTKGWEGGVPLPLCVCTHCVHSARAGAEPWTRAAPHPEQCWSLGAGYLPWGRYAASALICALLSFAFGLPLLPLLSHAWALHVLHAKGSGSSNKSSAYFLWALTYLVWIFPFCAFVFSTKRQKNKRNSFLIVFLPSGLGLFTSVLLLSCSHPETRVWMFEQFCFSHLTTMQSGWRDCIKNCPQSLKDCNFACPECTASCLAAAWIVLGCFLFVLGESIQSFLLSLCCPLSVYFSSAVTENPQMYLLPGFIIPSVCIWVIFSCQGAIKICTEER